MKVTFQSFIKSFVTIYDQKHKSLPGSFSLNLIYGFSGFQTNRNFTDIIVMIYPYRNMKTVTVCSSYSGTNKLIFLLSSISHRKIKLWTNCLIYIKKSLTPFAKKIALNAVQTVFNSPKAKKKPWEDTALTENALIWSTENAPSMNAVRLFAEFTGQANFSSAKIACRKDIWLRKKLTGLYTNMYRSNVRRNYPDRKIQPLSSEINLLNLR